MAAIKCNCRFKFLTKVWIMTIVSGMGTALKKERASSCETHANIYQFTRRHIPNDWKIVVEQFYGPHILTNVNLSTLF